MAVHTLKLSTDRVRAIARAWIDRAPEGSVLKLETEPKRSNDANAKMWAMLSDVANQIEHNGRKHTPETWKLLFMSSLGHTSRFEVGLDGEVFPIGFSSSALGVKEMIDLIDWIYKWGAENGVLWSERGWENET